MGQPNSKSEPNVVLAKQLSSAGDTQTQRFVHQRTGNEGLLSDTPSIDEPYEMIFYNRSKILELANESVQGNTRQDVQFLLDFIRKNQSDVWEKLEEIESGCCTKIGFEDLWLLYSPGTNVLKNDHGECRAFKVERVEMNTSRNSKALHISAYYLDFDNTGAWLIPQLEVLEVAEYSSERYVGKLELVPVWFARGDNDPTHRLIERGTEYCGYRGKVSYCEYAGDQWPRTSRKDPLKVIVDYVTDSKHWQDMVHWNKSINVPECFVCLGEALDLKAYPLGAPHDSDTCTKNLSPRASQCTKGDIDTTESLLFCPPKLWAFSVKHKSWRMVKARDLSVVREDSSTLNQLQMDRYHKDYLESMVISHLKHEKKGNNFDIIRERGRGLNVLLHGSPGTGKTLAVECIAEKHGVPLYLVTSGDLGFDPDVLERKLAEALLRAANWNAILLLDEADVFVQKRDFHDFRRNSIVSIFLRHLDYSEALLFMTTNRIDGIDPAFESRVNMKLRLPDFSFDEQKEIWNNLINRAREVIEVEEEQLHKFVKFNLGNLENGDYKTLNGREIMNCIQTATALARKDKSTYNFDILPFPACIPS
ncbi:putative AAA+ ATPase domain-containing protein [Seiridium cardinale]